MISINEAKYAIEEAQAVGLYGYVWFQNLGPERIAEACNGCGPEWLAEEWRKRLTEWLWLFFTPFCIHDCQFTYLNDALRETFNLANDDLERNCRLMADSEYGWWHPMRYVWRHRAHLVTECCRDFGWSAWRDAYGKTNGR